MVAQLKMEKAKKEQRVLFQKGKQRAFLEKVIEKLQVPSLRSLNQFGFAVPYGTLKCYYTQQRSLPRPFFEQLCYLIKLNPRACGVTYMKGTWGQTKGGKKSKRKSLK